MKRARFKFLRQIAIYLNFTALDFLKLINFAPKFNLRLSNLRIVNQVLDLTLKFIKITAI